MKCLVERNATFINIYCDKIDFVVIVNAQRHLEPDEGRKGGLVAEMSRLNGRFMTVLDRKPSTLEIQFDEILFLLGP